MKITNIKRILATFLTVACIGIPSVSMAEDTTLFELKFNQYNGKGEDDGDYTLAEMAETTGVPIRDFTDGDTLHIEQASAGSWKQPKQYLKSVPTERHMVGFDVPLGQTIKTGKLEIIWHISGMGGLVQRRYPLIFNRNKTIFGEKSGAWAVQTGEDTYSETVSYFHDKRIVLERANTDEDWKVSIEYPNWNNWQYFTISKEYLPEITSIGAASDLIPSNNEQSTCLRFNTFYAYYYPTPELSKSENVDFGEDIKVRFPESVGETAAFEIKELGGETVLSTCEWTDDKKTAVLTAREYFKPDTAYQVIITNAVGASKTEYNVTLNFKVKSEELTLKAPVEINLIDDSSVEAKATVLNSTGLKKNVMISLCAYNAEGLLIASKTSSLQDTSTPVSVLLTGTGFSKASFKVFVIEKSDDGSMTQIN